MRQRAHAAAAVLFRCHCLPEWSGGPLRGTPADDCSVRSSADDGCALGPGCSGHGRCVGGECVCDLGWSGPHCATDATAARAAALRSYGMGPR